ncbi:hypothetical protein DNTS_006127, partial [Danionella cerebrum]
MSADQEAKDDELLALASIYDEEEFHRTESGQEGEIHLCIELPADFRLLVKGQMEHLVVAASRPLGPSLIQVFSYMLLGQTPSEHTVSSLPPLVLSFELPADYPSRTPPIFTLSSKWLTRVQITALCRRLDELWEENYGNVILFTWIQFLKEETLDHLRIMSPLEIQSNGSQDQSQAGQRQAAVASGEKSKAQELDPRAVQEVDFKTDLLTLLLDFDGAQKEKVFNAKLFCCGICFSEKLGSDCLVFKECQHVYCKTCVKEYFEIQIKDGKVQCLHCPEPECTSMATPT